MENQRNQKERSWKIIEHQKKDHGKSQKPKAKTWKIIENQYKYHGQS